MSGSTAKHELGAAAVLIVLLILWALAHPAEVGRACLDGKPAACGFLAVAVQARGDQYHLGSECWKGTPMSCGLISLAAIASEQQP